VKESFNFILPTRLSIIYLTYKKFLRKTIIAGMIILIETTKEKLWPREERSVQQQSQKKKEKE
jgi:hypothetical protein